MKTFEDFYAKKDFKSALDTLKVRPQTMPESLWHYNLGLTYARLDNLPEARFQFLSAEKAGLDLPEVQQNESLVTDKLELGKLEKPLTPSDYFFKVSKYVSGGELLTMSLLFLCLGMISLRKNLSWKKFALVFFFAAVPVIFNWSIQSWPEAIVMEASKVQDGPSAIFASVAEVPAGVKVIVDGEGEWRKILYPSRFRGWISKTRLKELE